MQQSLFDQIVIVSLVLEEAENMNQVAEVERLVDTYLRDYSGETRAGILRDVKDAAEESRPAIDACSKALFGGSRFAVLDAIRQSISAEARSSRPLLRRIFGGTKFNYERAPLLNRVAQCKSDVVRAGAKLVATRYLSAPLVTKSSTE